MIRRSGFAMLVLNLALTLLGAPEQAVAGDPAKGKVVYEKHCVLCHGPQGKGDGPTGKVIQPPAADFTSARSKKKSPTDLLKVIEEGKANTAMVGWKRQLSDQDIRDVLAYVLTLRQ